MTRQIKFRAYDKDGVWDGTPRMYYNVQNSYDSMGDVQPEDPGASFGGILRHQSFIVMQFTGLLDKNGVEIYEGDICNVNQMVDCIWITERGVMQFRKELAQFSIKIHGDSWLAEDKDISNIEVIGNLWENPELLK